MNEAQTGPQAETQTDANTAMPTSADEFVGGTSNPSDVNDGSGAVGSNPDHGSSSSTNDEQKARQFAIIDVQDPANIPPILDPEQPVQESIVDPHKYITRVYSFS